MKRLIATMFLGYCIAVMLPTILHADYIIYDFSPKVRTKSIVVHAKKVKPIPIDTLKMIEKIQTAFPNAPVMVRIADAESDFIPTIKNPGSSASGLFQILRKTWNDYGCVGDFETSRFDPDANIACAKKLYQRSGTTPWNESKEMWG